MTLAAHPIDRVSQLCCEHYRLHREWDICESYLKCMRKVRLLQRLFAMSAVPPPQGTRSHAKRVRGECSPVQGVIKNEHLVALVCEFYLPGIMQTFDNLFPGWQLEGSVYNKGLGNKLLGR